MHIPELDFPGSRVAHSESDWAFQASILCDALATSLTDTALALTLYEQAMADLRGAVARRAASARVRGVPRDPSARRDFEPEADPFDAERAHAAEVRAKRARWANGETPRSYAQRLVFLHARSFLMALDRIERILHALSGLPDAPAGLATAHNAFQAHMPDLRGVRNSVSHHDQRLLGRGRELPRIPRVLENLSGNRFKTTTGAGRIGEVELSPITVDCARRCIQQAIDALPWTGHRRHYP